MSMKIMKMMKVTPILVKMDVKRAISQAHRKGHIRYEITEIQHLRY
jgi:hypothetical protein